MNNYFPNITRHWNMIATPVVITIDPEEVNMTSLKGRFICLVHLVATPIKAYSSLGKLVITALGIII